MDRLLKKATDATFLNWIADRLVNVYKESPNVDFVLRLREIATIVENDPTWTVRNLDKPSYPSDDLGDDGHGMRMYQIRP